MHVRTFLHKYILYIIPAVLALLLVAAYIAGFRVGPGGEVAKRGFIEVLGVPAGGTIYIDSVRSYEADGEPLRVEAFPTAHTIIVDVPGFQPWNEVVVLESEEVRTLSPLLVPETLQPVTLAASDMAKARTTLFTSALPTQNDPLELQNECVQVYVAQNRILATRKIDTACTPISYLCTDAGVEENGSCLPTIIFEPKETITSVTSYPSRSDALIVTSGNLSYVLELDPREPRFFAPLVRSANIRTASWDDTHILISSSEGMFILPL